MKRKPNKKIHVIRTNCYHHYPIYDSLNRKSDSAAPVGRGVWNGRQTERAIPNLGLGVGPIMQFGLDTALSSRANAPVQTQVQQPSILRHSP
jgi:hypothetical protein